MESSLEYPLSTRCLLLRLFKGGGSFGRNRKNRVPLSQQLARAESLPAKCPYEPVDGTSRVLPCQMSIWTSSWHEQSPSLLNTHMNQQMERAESFPAKCPYEPADGSSKVPPCQIPIWTSRWNEQSPSLPNDHKHVEQMCLFFFFLHFQPSITGNDEVPVWMKDVKVNVTGIFLFIQNAYSSLHGIYTYELIVIFIHQVYNVS